MLTLQIRQAETALREGRLDEAYDLIIQTQVRSHRRGQTAASNLLIRLKQRIAEHIAGNRYEAALRDCDRATKLGGNQADLVELREGVLEVMSVEREGQLQRNRIREAARQQIANGDLSIGYEICQQLPEATEEEHQLSSEIRIRQQAADKAVARAAVALENNAIEEAVSAVSEAQGLAAHRPSVCDMVQKTMAEIVRRSREELDAGQLGRAECRLRLAERLTHRNLELSQMTEVIQRLHEASQRIQHGKYAAAREQLQLVRQLLPGANWIDDTIDLTQQAQRAFEELRGGPLSLLSPTAMPTVSRSAGQIAPISPIMKHHSADTATSRLLVQVDGGGRSLAIRKDSVRLGPRIQRHVVDIAIQARESMPTLEFARLDDDYFLRTADPVTVNGQRTTSRLLADGDQIVAGSRCSMKFTLPCAANHSAVLQFAGAKLEPSDVRQVILMDDAFLIGPDSQSHIRVRQLTRRFVMLVRDDQFIVQPVAPAQLRSNEAQAISLGESIALDGVSLMIQQFDG